MTSTFRAAWLVLAAACGPVSARQVWFTYDATERSRPDAQCWTLQRSGGGEPLPSVTGGVLEIGPNSSAGYLYYSRPAAISAERGAVIEAEIFIVNSPYLTNPAGPASARERISACSTPRGG